MDPLYQMNEYFPPAMDVPSFIKPEHPDSVYPDLLKNQKSTVPMSTDEFYGHWQASIKDKFPGNEGWTPYQNEKIKEAGQDCLYRHDAEIDALTIFGSFEEAVEWRKSQMISTPLEADTTIPQTDKQKKACVKLLFKAWKSVADAKDNEKMQAAFKLQKHDNGRVEVVCWQILEALIRRAQTGPLLIEFDPSKNKEGANMRTFLERFNEVITSLKSSKTIAKHLLDSPYLNTFIDDPVGARGRVESNRKLNARKGETMRAGKQAQGRIPGARRKAERRARVVSYFAGRDTPETDASVPDLHHSTAIFNPSLTLVQHVGTGMELNSSKPGHQVTSRFDDHNSKQPNDLMTYSQSHILRSSAPVSSSSFNARTSNMRLATRQRNAYGPTMPTTQSLERFGNITPTTYSFLHPTTTLSNSPTAEQYGLREPEVDFNIPESLTGNIGTQFSSKRKSSSGESSPRASRNFEQQISSPSQQFDVPDPSQLPIVASTSRFQRQFFDCRLYSSPTEASSPL